MKWIRRLLGLSTESNDVTETHAETALDLEFLPIPQGRPVMRLGNSWLIKVTARTEPGQRWLDDHQPVYYSFGLGPPVSVPNDPTPPDWALCTPEDAERLRQRARQEGLRVPTTIMELTANLRS